MKQHRIDPRQFADLVNDLRRTALQCHGSQQLRARIVTILSEYGVSPDHVASRPPAEEGVKA